MCSKSAVVCAYHSRIERQESAYLVFQNNGSHGKGFSLAQVVGLFK